MNRKISIDQVVQNAVTAALSVIDLNTNCVISTRATDIGDNLAVELEDLIRARFNEFINSDDAPAFIDYE